MKLHFLFSDNTSIDSAWIKADGRITEYLYNDLNYADDSATFKLPFNETLSDKLKLEIDNNILVNVLDDDNSPIFTGYLRKNLNFTKTQRNQPISIELVSPSSILDTNYMGASVHWSNASIGTIVANLISLTPFEGTVDVHELASTRLPIFILNEGDNIKNILNQMLFEFGYVMKFSASGNLYLKELFGNVPNSITTAFNGSNCLNQIQQTAKESTFKNVSIEWYPVINASNVLIFADTTGANANTKANIDIAGNSYYLGTEINLLNYDSKYNKVLWIESATDNITFDSQTGVTKTFQNLGQQGSLSIFNGSASSVKITGLEVYGNGYFQKEICFNKSGSSTGSTKEIKTQYISNETQADYLCKKIANYYRWSKFNSVIQSKLDVTLGTYVTLSDDGIGTVTAKVVRKATDLATGVHEYVLENVSEYSPVEQTYRTQYAQSNTDSGDNLRGSIQELNTRVDQITTQTTMCDATVKSVTIDVDRQGKTRTRTVIETTISLVYGAEQLDFNFGTMVLPDGWTYDIEGKTITFYISEGAKLRSGSFNIPVQYRVVTDMNQYVDENGNPYIDENGNPYNEIIMSAQFTQYNIGFTYICVGECVYLGPISSIASLADLTPNKGDFLLWSGEDAASQLSYEGYFKKAKMYKFVGQQDGVTYTWDVDADPFDTQIVLGDILNIQNAPLEENNPQAYNFVSKFVRAETIWAQLIEATDGNFQNITTTNINVKNGLRFDGYYTATSVQGFINQTISAFSPFRKEDSYTKFYSCGGQVYTYGSITGIPVALCYTISSFYLSWDNNNNLSQVNFVGSGCILSGGNIYLLSALAITNINTSSPSARLTHISTSGIGTENLSNFGTFFAQFGV